MEDFYNNEYYAEDNNYKEPTLPISPQSGLDFPKLIKLNKIYANQLLNIFSNSSKTKRAKSKINLPYNDMKVLNSLIKEDIIYLFQILKFNQFKEEFDELYNLSMQILNYLDAIPVTKIHIYQNIQKLKLLELKFQNIRINELDKDYSNADMILDEIENIVYDQSMKDYITILDLASLNLNRAYIKFSIFDFENAKQYALDAAEIFDKGNMVYGFKNNKDNEEEEEKCKQKLAQIQEFLAEIYDLQRDYKNALSSYEKCYYFYLGRYGINNPLIGAIKKKKELYEQKVEELKREKKPPVNELINKLKEGKITKSKGQSETFSFVVPYTKISEPLIVKIYSLPKRNDNTDFFSDYLFLKNLYFDKLKLFQYLEIDDEFEQQNYILYTDEALNLILENIVLIDNEIIEFTDSYLYEVLINF